MYITSLFKRLEGRVVTANTDKQGAMFTFKKT